SIFQKVLLSEKPRSQREAMTRCTEALPARVAFFGYFFGEAKKSLAFRRNLHLPAAGDQRY
ncbi:MAG TPA: hypothetical protein VLC91_06420, partial [Spongiibacteraceae bacterium]|nr:hypothetical protein [Spongiibacteraceae bacterium]